MFQAVCEQNLEGIVAKRKNAPYRKAGWLKIKIKNRQYTEAHDRREMFDSRTKRKLAAE